MPQASEMHRRGDGILQSCCHGYVIYGNRGKPNEISTTYESSRQLSSVLSFSFASERGKSRSVAIVRWSRSYKASRGFLSRSLLVIILVEVQFASLMF